MSEGQPLAAFFNRVQKNARHWSRWARRRGITCYRVYDRDIPEFAFVLDIYGTHAHLQEYTRAPDDAMTVQRAAPTSQLIQATAEALELPQRQVVFKSRRKRHGQAQHEKTGDVGEDLVVEEAGNRFLVNLEAYLDTGLFLDHRNTRARIQAEVAGKRFLNLFCYTAAFSVCAATGGAATSLSLDLSNRYLDWAGRNFDLNQIDTRAHRLLRADVVCWLEEARRGAPRFDLILLDPPSFSTSNSMEGVLDVQRDHVQLIDACADLLSAGGIVYFSTNLRSFRLAEAAFARFTAQEISHLTVPEDFRNRRIHRCWRAVKH